MGTNPGPDSLSTPVDLVVDIHEEALGTLTAQAEQHPDYADLHHRLGLLHYVSGRPEQAVACHERALSINPNYQAARSALGYAFEAAGDLGHAWRVWRQPFEDGKPLTHHVPVIDLAMAEARRGAATRGLELLDQLPESERQRDLVIRERVLLLALAGREAEAGRWIAHLQGRSAYFRDYFVSEGVITVGTLDLDRAAGFIVDRETNHNLAGVHEYLSETYAIFGVFRRAETELQAGLHADFDLAAFHMRLGKLKRLEGQASRAAEEFGRAIEYDRAHVGARIEFGHELASLGQKQAAIEQFEEAARLRPGYADVHHQLGLLYLESGKLEESRAALERALEINPEFALARASLALCCLRAGLNEQALEAYSAAIEAGLCSADLYMNMALVHLRRGEREWALELLQRGIEVGPYYPPLYYHLGRVFREMGKKEEAREAWRRFFECADEQGLTERLDLFLEDLRAPALSA